MTGARKGKPSEGARAKKQADQKRTSQAPNPNHRGSPEVQGEIDGINKRNKPTNTEPQESDGNTTVMAYVPERDESQLGEDSSGMDPKALKTQKHFSRDTYWLILTNSILSNKSKKGAARTSTRPTINKSPGDLKYPGSFLNIESNEQKLGAYLRYNDVACLRQLAITWLALKAFLTFAPIASNMNKKAAFRLIQDNEQSFIGVDPSSV
ncbi:hypothetical protein AJ80_08754 [Polytolypa hystricis UAMH7299]|uniref:Uncharacterized protein n=1 Tax=Polytolypa hystricis (strain UAMH7299) TaxID=1447883 RepID=A0A2B7X2E0_POLH7|nr:hypothetical protein AJ80_08754 [Polytolypa hystricis UAMH7299]